MIHLKLFLIFLKLGAFIFGAGHALASAIQEEVVARGWLTAEDYQDGWAIASALPGPISIKMVTYTGYKVAGVWGAISSVLGYILPSAALMGLASFLFLRFRESRVVEAALRGIKPAVLALIAVAAFKFLKLGAVGDLRAYAVAAAAFGILAFTNISPVFVVLGAALVGLTYLWR
ncbi:chromate transporter [Candidatus Poribacteria bacterium]|nr:MAG: chromate transporter [Candidatus Poribacteria bacterium]